MTKKIVIILKFSLYIHQSEAGVFKKEIRKVVQHVYPTGRYIITEDRTEVANSCCMISHVHSEVVHDNL